ncbi:MAG: DUF5615 family PIN-like protein [Tepidisphaeraceae bacterium]
MKLLADNCIGRTATQGLRDAGHDVLAARDLGADPGDVALLALAFGEGRVLITLDADFGELVFHSGYPHRGIVRLLDVPAKQQAAVACAALASYEAELAGGAVVTAERHRVRVTRVE